MVPFPAKERLGKLRQLMSQEGLDFCVLAGPENMNYFSCFQAIFHPPHPLCGGRR